MATIPMNQAQINYFTQRVTDIKKIKIRDLDELIPLPEELSHEEMLMQIATGKATLKEIPPDECNYKGLITSFTYEGEDLIAAQKRDATAMRDRTSKKIEKYSMRLIDKFVLRKFKNEEEVTTVLDTFEYKDFINGNK